MKKIIVLSLISLCLFLTACTNAITQPVENFSTSQTENSEDEKKDEPEQSNTQIDDSDIATFTPSESKNPNKPEMNLSPEKQDNITDFDYENALLQGVGEDYLSGRASMRVGDQEIFGVICAVFKIGTNSDEKFTTEDWVAVSQNGMVYSYDVCADEWSEYKADEPCVIDYEKIDNCIYVLNDYLQSEYTVEYYDTDEYIKQSIFEDGKSADTIPDKLIGIYENAPQGYTSDPLERVYYPVYNFNSTEELSLHLSNYFTQSYFEEINFILCYDFLDFEGTLYLVRGGVEYGAVTLDFDSIDYTNFETDNTVLVDKLLFDEKDGKFKITFDTTEGSLKISKVEDV